MTYIWQVWNHLEDCNGDEPELIGTYDTAEKAEKAREDFLNEKWVKNTYTDYQDPPTHTNGEGVPIEDCVNIKRCAVK